MRRAAIPACMATFLVFACGSNGTTITHDQNGGATVVMGDKTGGMTAKVAGPGRTVVPDDLPAWAPAYPGAKVSQVVDIAFHGGSNMPGGPHRQVVLMTSDPVAKVMAFYDQKLAAAGVKPLMTSDQPDGAMRAINTPSGQPDTITVGKTDDGSGIGITYAVKR